MSIALVTILFFVFLFPGIFFTRFYYTEEFSKQYFKSSYYELLLSTLLPSIIIHIAGLYLADNCLGYKLDLKSVLILLLGIDDINEKSIAIESIQSSVKNIVLYNLVVWVLSGFLGYSFKKIIRKFKIDRKHKLFRFHNEWHYLITGEILDFPKIDGEASKIDFVSVDAVIDTDAGTFIYSGIIQDYLLSKQGGLELIYLTEVNRRLINDDPQNDTFDNLEDENESDDRLYFMPGDFFVLPYKEIKNINITYYEIEEVENEDDIEDEEMN